MKKGLAARHALTAFVFSLAFMPISIEASTLKLRLAEDPETLFNAQTISGGPNTILGNFLLDRLVYLDAKGDPQPWLARGWTFSEDGKVVTFRLRDGIKFHDGTPFNASAVKFHFDFVLDKKNASPILPYCGPLLKVEAPSDDTVVFTFDRPYAPFLNNLAQASFGINSPTAIAKEGKQYGRNPVGTGPFRFKSWIPGSEITLVRNPDYQQFRNDVDNPGPARTDEVLLSVIPEESIAAAALESGELSAAELSADAMMRFANDPEFKTVVIKNVNNIIFLEYNQKRPPFDDPAFRHALAYAVDREAIVKASFGGFAAIALSPLSLGIPGFDPEVGQRYGTPYDPAKARELLTTAGWTMGPSGVLQKDGKEARLILRSYTGYPYVERSIALIQSGFKKLGIELIVQTADWGTYYPGLRKADWDINFLRWNWNDAVVMNNLFRSPGHRGTIEPTPAVDSVLDRCSTLIDQQARKSCLSEAQKVLLENSVMLPLTSNYRIIATSPEVKGFHADFIGYLLATDIDLGR
jgi:peptide/nickel transport system substrate-binding protein